ncbi:MAG: HAMP domain-containing sensor histidine kinase [Bacteroidota bacterium]|nr:HAMP domain-containing sensor histidine kinase [Bacteroidota bacterium]
MKLISRYNRSFFPALVLLFLISGLVSYFLTRKILQDEVDEGLLRIYSRISDSVRIHQTLPTVATFDDLKLNVEPATKPMIKPVLESARVFIPEQNENHRARQLLFTVLIKENLYKITVSTPLEGTKTMTKAIVFITTVTIFIILLTLAVISRLLLNKIWKPFYASLQLVRNFKVDKAGSLHFPPTVIDEFMAMNDNFKMATENATNDYRRLKEFTENASHEIQTPLAIIRAKLDLLAQQEQLSEYQSELLKDTFGAVTKLSKLNHSLLLIAKIENRQFDTKVTVDLSQKLENKINQFQELWQTSQIQFIPEIGHSEIIAHPELVEILLNNIFSNATRHNLPGGLIGITLTEKELRVRNTGQFKALEKEKLFTRFYKESVNDEHNGLGLSIIKQICEVTGILPGYKYNEGYHVFIFNW